MNTKLHWMYFLIEEAAAMLLSNFYVLRDAYGILLLRKATDLHCLVIRSLKIILLARNLYVKRFMRSHGTLPDTEVDKHFSYVHIYKRLPYHSR